MYFFVLFLGLVCFSCASVVPKHSLRGSKISENALALDHNTNGYLSQDVLVDDCVHSNVSPDACRILDIPTNEGTYYFSYDNCTFFEIDVTFVPYPTVSPTDFPSLRPSVSPSVLPSFIPTQLPTRRPSAFPTLTFCPTQLPSSMPSAAPSSPSSVPTDYPSADPSSDPTSCPTLQPSSHPSSSPSLIPFSNPTSQPSIQPKGHPSSEPSTQPSNKPTSQPSTKPSRLPSSQPASKPTQQPSSWPSNQPTSQPSREPSDQPTAQPSQTPSIQPSSQPSGHPSGQPSINPTSQPSCHPSRRPSSQPSSQPTRLPTSQPTRLPTSQPTCQPSSRPSSQPSRRPSSQPSRQPSQQPTSQPSRQPTRRPTGQPSRHPSSQPSRQPSRQPTGQPSRQPTRRPTGQPSRHPSSQPSRQPSRQPTGQPSRQPTRQPTAQPSSRPTSKPSIPTSHPSSQPSFQPTGQPSRAPSHDYYINLAVGNPSQSWTSYTPPNSDDGDGGLATLARLRGATTVAADTAGNLYILENPFGLKNGSIRCVYASSGTIQTVVGRGSIGNHAVDSNNNVVTAAVNTYFLSRATSVRLWNPASVFVDTLANVYWSDINCIFKSVAGTTYKFIGDGSSNSGTSGNGTPYTSSKIAGPGGMWVNTLGWFFFGAKEAIRYVDSTGIIREFAGGTFNNADNIPATSTHLSSTNSFTGDTLGNMYLCDYGIYRVRLVASTTGIISTFVGTGSPPTTNQEDDLSRTATSLFPYWFGFYKDEMYVTDLMGLRVRWVKKYGVVTTFAGTGAAGTSGDGGRAINAQFSNGPLGAAVVGSSLYVASPLTVRVIH